MSDSSQRTEQPTPKRLEKAKRDGQFPASREFVSGVVFLTFIWLARSQAGNALAGAARMMRETIDLAFREDLTPQAVSGWLTFILWRYMVIFCAVGFCLSILAIGVHFITTGFGVAGGKLVPDLARLSPLSRLRQLPSQNFSALVQSLILLPMFGWLVWGVAKASWAEYQNLPRLPLNPALARVGSSLGSLLWKAALVLFVLGCLDLLRQRRRWMSQLRMSKQEIREEQKESEGNPMIRMRIRRLQREALRRRMLQQVPKATAVIVNPTHYAVAVRYQMSTSGAPKVVAKGKNLVALRIREAAIRNQVPVVENPPLAQALYGSVEVGQEIPAHLYQAVAEVLAYIYRLMRGNMPGQ